MMPKNAAEQQAETLKSIKQLQKKIATASGKLDKIYKESQKTLKTLSDQKRHYSSETTDQLGLPNKGNTCYLHSAIQAIAAIPEIEKHLKTQIIVEQNPSSKNIAAQINALKKQLSQTPKTNNETLKKIHQDYFLLSKELEDALVLYTAAPLILLIKEEQKGVPLKLNIEKTWERFVKYYQWALNVGQEQEDVSQAINTLTKSIKIQNTAYETKITHYPDIGVIPDDPVHDQDIILSWKNEKLRLPHLFAQEHSMGKRDDGSEIIEIVRTNEKEAPKFLMIHLAHGLNDYGDIDRKSYHLPFEEQISIMNNENKPLSNTYILSSICVKEGGIESGHYIQYYRAGNQWFCADDASISPLNPRQVLTVLANQDPYFYPCQVVYSRKDCFAAAYGLEKSDLAHFERTAPKAISPFYQSALEAAQHTVTLPPIPPPKPFTGRKSG